MLTDIRRFIGAIGTVLLAIAAPAFGDTGHLVLTHELRGAARLGMVVGLRRCEKEKQGKTDVSSREQLFLKG